MTANMKDGSQNTEGKAPLVATHIGRDTVLIDPSALKNLVQVLKARLQFKTKAS
jgi:hypothetical protein